MTPARTTTKAQMQTLYEGTKRVLASPMTRADYNAYRGWELPANEDGADTGYLVEYTDGGKANDSRHAGYISWSPSDVFDRAYKAVRVPQPHQQRVVEEKGALDEKIVALTKFIFTNPVHATVPAYQRELLREQMSIMMTLSEILGQRIAAF